MLQDLLMIQKQRANLGLEYDSIVRQSGLSEARVDHSPKELNRETRTASSSSADAISLPIESTQSKQTNHQVQVYRYTIQFSFALMN